MWSFCGHRYTRLVRGKDIHTQRSAVRVNPSNTLAVQYAPPSRTLQEVTARSVKLPCGIAGRLEQRSCQRDGDVMEMASPCAGSLGGSLFGHRGREAMEQAKGRGSHPVYDGVVNERNDSASVGEGGPRCGMVPRSLGHLAAMEVLSVGAGRHGRSCDHDICSKACAFWSESNKVSSLGVIVSSAHSLFSHRVPTRFAAYEDPLVAHAVVSSNARTLGTGAGMGATGAKLDAAVPARRQGRVLATLAGRVDGKAHVLCERQAEGPRVDRSEGTRYTTT